MLEVTVLDSMGGSGARKKVLEALGSEAVAAVLLNGRNKTVDVETATRTIRSGTIFRWAGTGSGVNELAKFFEAVGWPYDEAFLSALGGDDSFKITSLSWHQIVAGERVR